MYHYTRNNPRPAMSRRRQRLVTRHMSIVVKRWIAGADGLPWWSSSQVLANNNGVCGVWVCVLLCQVFIKAVHLGNKVIFYPLSPLTLQVTVNSCNATQTLLNPSVPEIRNFFQNSSHPLFVIVATHLPTSKEWKPEFWLSVSGVEPRTFCTVIQEWTCTHAARVLAL